MFICTKLFARIRFRQILAIACLACFVNAAHAEPWLDTSNVSLRTEVQFLADRGLIMAPVNTYPLMWAAIAPDLQKIDPDTLDAIELNAYVDVMNQLAIAKGNQLRVRLNVSNENNRFASFGDDYRDKNFALVSVAAQGYRWAFKLAPSFTLDPNDGDEFRLDESYVAGFLGNWVFALGLQDRWWAPGWDTNLSLTSNARPMPAVSITRKSSEPFRLFFTDYMIPWNVTTFMADMGDDRTIENALLWGFRFDFMPYKHLELGVTRLAQWAGDGRPDGLSTFWDVLLGRENCGADIECTDTNDDPGNQQFGVDARLSVPMFGSVLGLYGQFFAEDGSDSSIKFWSKKRNMFGIDTTVMLGRLPVLTFLEYTDTFEFCGNGRETGIGNCYYEHYIYNTGLRYKGRNIGNLYDNDATSVVFGMISQWYNNANWQWRLRYVQLNQDNSDRYPGEPNGNTVTEIAEDLLMLSGRYERIFGRWKWAVGGSVSTSEFIDKDSENDYVGFIDMEYQL